MNERIQQRDCRVTRLIDDFAEVKPIHVQLKDGRFDCGKAHDLFMASFQRVEQAALKNLELAHTTSL